MGPSALGYCFLVCIVVALVVSRLDARWRRLASNTMREACPADAADIEVLLVGPPKPNHEALSDALLSVFHNAKCPKRVHVTMIEAVEQLERQSTTLMRYKEKALARGRYNEPFLEQVTAIQVVSSTTTCMFSEAVPYAQSERARVSLVADADTLLMPDWDDGLIDAYDALPATGAALYCGTADGQPAYTAVERFEKGSPVVVPRPVLRSTAPLECIWASLPFAVNSAQLRPILVAAEACTPTELGLRLTHRVGLQFWTSSKAIGARLPSQNGGDAAYASYANPKLHEPDALLGVRADRASPVEIITKFGSLGNFQWASRRQ